MQHLTVRKDRQRTAPGFDERERHRDHGVCRGQDQVPDLGKADIRHDGNDLLAFAEIETGQFRPRNVRKQAKEHDFAPVDHVLVFHGRDPRQLGKAP